MANKITVTSAGNKVNVSTNPDMSMFYTERSREWAISDKIVNNEDFSSKYYANESKKQADISTAKTTEVVESGNTAVSNIENARDNAIIDITNQENVSVDNVNTAGATQIALATEQANIATQQATIATNKASEVVVNGNEALSNIDTAKTGAITDITDLKNDSISSIDTAKSEALTEIETLHSSSITDITGLKNTSITDITNLKNTSVSDITTAKDNAITSITNQETISKNNIIDEGATQVGLIQNEGTTQINLTKEQVTLATNQANIATEKANIATTQANTAIAKTLDVVESGNNALSNIAAAKNNALDEINLTVDNAEQYAQNALNSANNAAISENNALLYKNNALENSQIATTQANIATSKANEATTSAASARTSETNAKSSENRCEEILTRLGTSIKIKGRVESFGDLPSSGNLDGDTYLVGEEGLSSYPEYYWYLDHWEFMGTTTSLVWGSITGDISAQTDLTNKLNSKQDVGNYALKSEIPTNNNQLTNGAGYITSSYHDSTKQDVITDLATIRAGASKGATALQPGDNISKLANDAGYTTNIGTITGITMNGASKGTSGVINLGTVITAHQDISGKQDVITDLATIRAGASKGATALQSIPAEYITETELNAKGYVTTTELLEQMTNKLDINASNLDATGKSLISGLGMPSNKYIDLTLGASGTYYDVPADGYIEFVKTATADNQVVSINVLKEGRTTINSSDDVEYGFGHFLPNYNFLWNCTPIAKGRRFRVYYNAGGTLIAFRFIYAKGSESEV